MEDYVYYCGDLYEVISRDGDNLKIYPVSADDFDLGGERELFVNISEVDETDDEPDSPYYSC